MATLNEFLEKALVDEGSLMGQGDYKAYIKLEVFLKNMQDEDEAMGTAQSIADKIVGQNRKYKAQAEIDGLDGPM
jgi:hypothetical protein